jgi:regulation of enolase protein 1 (concanavalin A-like superfamily)
VPNLLYDFNNWAQDYYGEILNDSGHTVFVKSPEQFIETLKHHKFYDKEEITKKSEAFIKRDFKANLQRVLESKILIRNNE